MDSAVFSEVSTAITWKPYYHLYTKNLSVYFGLGQNDPPQADSEDAFRVNGKEHVAQADRGHAAGVTFLPSP